MESLSHSQDDSQGSKIVFSDSPKIILLEDDRSLSTSLKIYLKSSFNADVLHFESGATFLESFINKNDASSFQPFCFLVDVSLGEGQDGLFFIDLLKEKKFQFFSIVMTGFGSIENAISATRRGIFHYLTKPFDLENLNRLIIEGFALNLKTIIHNINVIKFGNQHQKIVQTDEMNRAVKLPDIKEENMFESMVGKSLAMRNIFEDLEKISKSSSTVLIKGESGTGKELIAKAIHNLSARSQNKMVSLNCGAIPRDLLESELFGHKKGAFSGAISDRDGKFLCADKSTLFLDEIGDLEKNLQVKLLRVIQTNSIGPVGSDTLVNVDVRVIAATHQDLESEISRNNFREDLFYRLNVIPIDIPPLRERREDIPLLLSFFLNRFVSADKSNQIQFSKSAFEQLMSYSWPGNVRELENVVERLVILKGGKLINSHELPEKIFHTNPLQDKTYMNVFELPEEGIKLKEVLCEIENSLISQALKRTSGNKNQASVLLGLNRTTLIEKIKKKQLFK